MYKSLQQIQRMDPQAEREEKTGRTHYLIFWSGLIPLRSETTSDLSPLFAAKWNHSCSVSKRRDRRKVSTAQWICSDLDSPIHLLSTASRMPISLPLGSPPPAAYTPPSRVSAVERTAEIGAIAYNSSLPLLFAAETEHLPSSDYLSRSLNSIARQDSTNWILKAFLFTLKTLIFSDRNWKKNFFLLNTFWILMTGPSLCFSQAGDRLLPVQSGHHLPLRLLPQSLPLSQLTSGRFICNHSRIVLGFCELIISVIWFVFFRVELR